MAKSAKDTAKDPNKDTAKGKDIAKLVEERKRVNRILLMLQLIASFVALVTAAVADVLPANYFGSIAIILFLLLFMAFLLLLVSARQKKRKTGKRRTIGLLISIATTIICIIASFMLIRVIQTLNGINDLSQESRIGVYVLTDDPAQSIEDAEDYTFGCAQDYDLANTQKAITEINDELSAEIATAEYETVTDMVDNLYDNGGAIILNEAYVDVLADLEGYEDISDRIRLIYEVTIEAELSANAADDVTEDPFVVYISGSDGRTAGLTRSRSDVNILAFVNPNNKQILLVNTPRDYYVDMVIPGENGEQGTIVGKDKLTHCGSRGMDCSIQTLENLYGVDVNYYAQINFTGVVKLVDSVGGITVRSDRKFKSGKNASLSGQTYRFKKGKNELNGDQALAFARERKHLADGDIGRGAHQMAVIKGLAQKVQSPAVLTNWSSILSSIEGMFATDLSAGEMSDLVKMQLGDGGEWNIKTFNVTGANGSEYVYSYKKKPLYVMYQDEAQIAQAKHLIEMLYNGEKIRNKDLEKQ